MTKLEFSGVKTLATSQFFQHYVILPSFLLSLILVVVVVFTSLSPGVQYHARSSQVCVSQSVSLERSCLLHRRPYGTQNSIVVYENGVTADRVVVVCVRRLLAVLLRRFPLNS